MQNDDIKRRKLGINVTATGVYHTGTWLDDYYQKYRIYQEGYRQCIMEFNIPDYEYFEDSLEGYKERRRMIFLTGEESYYITPSPLYQNGKITYLAPGMVYHRAVSNSSFHILEEYDSKYSDHPCHAIRPVVCLNPDVTIQELTMKEEEDNLEEFFEQLEKKQTGRKENN